MKKGLVLVLGLFILSAGSLFANDFWVAPAAPTVFSNAGYWAVMRPGTVYFAFNIPDNLQTFTAAKVVLIPRKTRAIGYDLYLSGSKSGNAQNDFNTQLLAQSLAGTENQLTEIDVSALVKSAVDAQKDYVTLYFTGGADAQVVGLRFSYVGPTGPKGDMPAHEWNGANLRFQNPNGSWGGWAFLMGPQGLQGIQGIKGDKGDQGEQGIQGIQGIQGEPGPGCENIKFDSFYNTGVGVGALINTTSATQNTALGYMALTQVTKGIDNVAIGYRALAEGGDDLGDNNIAIGTRALTHCVAGQNNIAIGTDSLVHNNGGDNIAIGNGISWNWNGSNNIYIGTKDTHPYALNPENNTIRIGTWGQHKQLFVNFETYQEGGQVTYFGGQLGTLTSSIKNKEDVNSMGDASSRIFDLRPVTFRYKKGIDKGSSTLRFGLIAEEVANVYPELVIFGPDGQPDTVSYNGLSATLLNEVQKQQRKINELSQDLQRQADIIAHLEARLAALEGQIK